MKILYHSFLAQLIPKGFITPEEQECGFSAASGDAEGIFAVWTVAQRMTRNEGKSTEGCEKAGPVAELPS